MSKIKEALARVISLASERPVSYDEAIHSLNDIDTCKVRIWLEDRARLPKYAHGDDACMDLYVKSIEMDGGRVIYHTGVHVALPEDYEMEIRPRSSITKTRSVIQNAPGTIDGGYRGEITVVCRRIDEYDDPCYYVGDRVAQLLVRRRERVEWEEVGSLEELGHTERGDGGYGSTGK